VATRRSEFAAILDRRDIAPDATPTASTATPDRSCR
jgi:hypothetical protein